MTDTEKKAFQEEEEGEVVRKLIFKTVITV